MSLDTSRHIRSDVVARTELCYRMLGARESRLGRAIQEIGKKCYRQKGKIIMVFSNTRNKETARNTYLKDETQRSGREPSKIKSEERASILTTLFLFSLTLPIVFSIGSITLNLPRLTLLIAFVPCLLRLCSGQAGPIKSTDLLFAGFTFWFAVSMLSHHGVSQIERVGQNTLDFYGSYLLARVTITNAQQFRKTIQVLTLAAAVLVPLVLLEALTGRLYIGEIINRVPFLSSYPHAEGPPRLGLDRAQGSFPHPILYGVFSSSLIAFSILVRRSKGIMMLVAIGGFLSLSSVALLQVVLQFFALTWRALFRSFSKRWWVLLAIFATFYILVDIASNRSPIRVFVSYATFTASTGYHRMLTWHYGIQNVIDHPILGIGLFQWERPAWLSSSVDNFWLNVAMWTGFPGVLLMIAGIFWAVFAASRRMKRLPEEAKPFAEAWIITVITLCISVTTVHVWNTAYAFMFFVVGSGMWIQNRTNNVGQNEGIEERGGKNCKEGMFREDERRPSRKPNYTRFPP